MTILNTSPLPTRLVGRRIDCAAWVTPGPEARSKHLGLEAAVAIRSISSGSTVLCLYVVGMPCATAKSIMARTSIWRVAAPPAPSVRLHLPFEEVSRKGRFAHHLNASAQNVCPSSPRRGAPNRRRSRRRSASSGTPCRTTNPAGRTTACYGQPPRPFARPRGKGGGASELTHEIDESEQESAPRSTSSTGSATPRRSTRRSTTAPALRAAADVTTTLVAASHPRRSTRCSRS